MKTLVIALLVTSSAFAATQEKIECILQYRAVMKAHRDHVKATDKVAADSLDTANYVVAVANELIVQSDRRVGAYGYGLRTEGNKAIDIANRLQTAAKAKEAVMDEAFLQLENCLLGIQEEPSEPQPQPEQI